MTPTTSPAPRGADLLVQALQRAGMRTVFTLSGNHIMSVFDALIGTGIRLIHTCHEAAAMHMADAAARLTGEVGIALVTGDPGHANAVSALYTAAMAEAPVVLLSGHAPTAQAGRGAFQEMPPADIAAPPWARGLTPCTTPTCRARCAGAPRPGPRRARPRRAGCTRCRC